MSDDDAWVLHEEPVDRDSLSLSEPLFALSNGHIGLRGTLDEGEPRVAGGTFLNGFYEQYPLEYGETGFGFAEEGQAVVDVPDGKTIRLLVENEPVDIERGEVLHHKRWLDMRTGLLEREMEWCSAYGDHIVVRTQRMVSFVQRSVAAIRFEVEAKDRPLRIALQSALVATGEQRTRRKDPRAGRDLGVVLQSELAVNNGVRSVLGHTTRRTGLSVASGMDHVIDAPENARISGGVEENRSRVTVSVRLEPGEVLRVDKFLAYHWSSRQTVSWLRDQVDASLENALAEGWDGLLERQRSFLEDWWERADIELDGDESVQRALRLSQFHLMQASVRAEGRAIAAKGLTGSGYDGHAFWDTEAYVLPVLTYLEPRAVRDALEWRYTTLELARERAKDLGLEGAVLPWRTIHGEECSGYWPAGLAAVHVNSAVADAVCRYVNATGDDQFASTMGLELLIESARLWIDLGTYGRDGAFRIAGVTGPDEYSSLGDDNVYTNVMAQLNLRCAAEFAEQWCDEAAAFGVDDEERARWRGAAEAMHIPYDKGLGVHPQSEGFLQLGVWDFEHTKAEDYPLLLNHPYFELYRKQVVKQADLVLALWKRGDLFSDEDKLRDFDYYEGITVRDSSLSAAAQAIVAADVGHVGLAWAYLREAALTDIHGLHGNPEDGLHMASLGGAVLAATNGLGGFRDHDGRLTFRPRVPEQVTRLRFRLLVNGTRLCVTVTQDDTEYVTEHGDPVTIEHWGEELEVGSDPVRRDNPPPPDLEAPKQPKFREPMG